eukprot:620048-Amphidinium_carterae.1
MHRDPRQRLTAHYPYNQTRSYAMEDCIVVSHSNGLDKAIKPSLLGVLCNHRMQLRHLKVRQSKQKDVRTNDISTTWPKLTETRQTITEQQNGPLSFSQIMVLKREKLD